MPAEIQDAFGYALDLAQRLSRADYARPMSGNLRDVTEIRAHDDTGKSIFRKHKRLSARTKADPDVEIEVLSGNVFAQLGLPHPEERLRKARLMWVINETVRRRGYTQKDVAQRTGLHQADISRIAHGQGSRYSTDRLLNVLDLLGVDIELVQRRNEAGDFIVEVRELGRVGARASVS
jgi:predicted XRE-type DNA-binding protein